MRKRDECPEGMSDLDARIERLRRWSLESLRPQNHKAMGDFALAIIAELKRDLETAQVGLEVCGEKIDHEIDKNRKIEAERGRDVCAACKTRDDRESIFQEEIEALRQRRDELLQSNTEHVERRRRAEWGRDEAQRLIAGVLRGWAKSVEDYASVVEEINL